ncbi:MAG TPA: IS21-like element helper ATPase IstB [Thermodesulfobacteriota bacterium]|nr:IS21-like element helper ATPase IstB [Thermodesulfobacteriota bacterium]
MNLQHQLEEQLKVLHLGGFLQTLELRLQQAQGSSLGYIEFLQLLVQDEIERREAKKLNLRLSRASFEEEKSLEGFDFSFNPKLNAKVIRDLGNGSFIEKREHVLLYGSTGVGKSHIAQALGHQACRLGYEVLFSKAVKLFRYLMAGRADHSWEKRIKKYLAPDVLIIDDFALSTLTSTQAEDFYEIVAERHLKSSIIITSNRPPQDWVPLFPDPVMANSALDRLVHYAHHLVMEGDSYRKKLSPKSSTPSPPKVGR